MTHIGKASIITVENSKQERQPPVKGCDLVRKMWGEGFGLFGSQYADISASVPKCEILVNAAVLFLLAPVALFIWIILF